MKIENIGKAEAVMLGNEIMEAVNKIAAKYGLEAKRGGGRYGDGSEYKLNSIVMFKPSGSGSGMIPSKENKLEEMWKLKRGQFGMEDINVGDVFQNQKGENIKLVGWDSKKRKYPVIYQNMANGGQYKSTPVSFKNNVYGI